MPGTRTEAAQILHSRGDAHPAMIMRMTPRFDETAHAGPYSRLREPMLERAGLEIRDAWHAGSRTYARYVCAKP